MNINGRSIKNAATLLTCLIIMSCKQEHYLESICRNGKSFVKDTATGSASNVANLTSEYFKLKTLSKQSDTFYLRIDYETDSTSKIFDFSYYNAIATFKVYTFNIDSVDGRILFDRNKNIPDQFLKFYHPTFSPEDFIKTLKGNEILELPDQNTLESYPVTYSKNYTIEFSNKCAYRIFSYSDPYLNRNKFLQAKKLTDFLDYLRINFEF